MNKKINSRVKNDLTKKLADIIKDKKVLVQVDAANIYFAAQQKNWNIDFKNIATWFKANSLQTDLVYYTAFDIEDQKQTQYLLDMAENQYRVFKKPLKIFNDETRKGNLDVEIAIDAMMHIFNFEIFVLLSGDGDFTYLVQTLESLGKKVIIIGIAGFMSYELHSQAGNFFFLDRIKDVWQTPKTDKKSLLNEKTKIPTKDSKIQSSLQNPPLSLKKDSGQVNFISTQKENSEGVKPKTFKPRPKNLKLKVDTQKEAQFLSANNISAKLKPILDEQKTKLNHSKKEQNANKSNLDQSQSKNNQSQKIHQKIKPKPSKLNLKITPKLPLKSQQPNITRSIPTIELE